MQLAPLPKTLDDLIIQYGGAADQSSFYTIPLWYSKKKETRKLSVGEARSDSSGVRESFQYTEKERPSTWKGKGLTSIFSARSCCKASVTGAGGRANKMPRDESWLKNGAGEGSEDGSGQGTSHGP